MELALHQAIVVYVVANLVLTFALALPAAGMVNHLLAGTASLGRGALVWLLFSLACWLLTLPVIPIIRRRRQADASSSE